MSLWIRSGVVVFLLLLIILGIYYFSSGKSDEITRKINNNEIISVRLAFLSEKEDGKSLEALVRVEIHPQKKHVLLYLLNTDAYYDRDIATKESVSSLTPDVADRFHDYTGKRNDYYITITEKGVARLLNLMGGTTLFLENDELFENGRFQYPSGIHTFSGDQTTEFAFARKVENDPTRKHLTGVERIFRLESVMLTVLWNLEDYYKLLVNENLTETAYQIPDTSMNREELQSLMKFLAENSMETTVLETPLEETPAKRIRRNFFEKKLIVNEERARSLYREFEDRMKREEDRQAVFKIDILNSTEKNGFAKQVKQYITTEEFVVMDVDNFSGSLLKKSIILDRTGSTLFSRKLAHISGLDKDRVFFRRRLIGVDATLILGEDFSLKKVKIY